MSSLTHPVEPAASEDYTRITRAITYLIEHAAEQPGLDQLAAHLQLSPFHLQRLFSRWAGTTPKRFLQVVTLERGKQLLDQSRSLLEVSLALGLSGSSRLHDHFVTLEAVTPGQYKSRGQGIEICYGVHPTPFGEMFIATTPRGICRATFLDPDDLAGALHELVRSWPAASVRRDDAGTQAIARAVSTRGAGAASGPMPVFVSGTNFQVAVWRALLEIPPGMVISYSALASALGYPKASRAVGNAIGANPVAMLIPCHRVIQQSGALGGYRWGTVRKQTIQAWERLQAE